MKRKTKEELDLGKHIDLALWEELEQTIIVGGKKHKRDLASELTFEPDNLNRYTGKQPRLFAFYVSVLAKTRHKRGVTEARLAEAEAKHWSKAIRQLKIRGYHRPAKGEIRSYIHSKSPKCDLLNRRLSKLDMQVEILQGIVTAFDQRGKLMKDAFYIQRSEQ